MRLREASGRAAAALVRERPLLLIMAAALLLHLVLALPGLRSGDPERFFSRPDSAGYLAPARSLAADGRFLAGPEGPEQLQRPPGYPAFLAAQFRLFSDAGGIPAAILLSGLVGVLTAIPIRLAGRELTGSDRIGLLAAALFCFQPTAAANRPLLLSDTLFGLAAAIQLYWFVRFYRRRRPADFLAAVGVAAAGALIRPINVAWIWPALFLLAIAPGIGWKRKLATAAAALALFFAILLPWMQRNASLGAGYCVDTNTGAMYHQNGAMLLAAVNGTDYEAEKQRILSELETEFADRTKYPDEKSRVDYRLARFKALILAHPGAWIAQHFQWRILLPDLPTLGENLGLTQSDRGTLNVLQTRGILAAVNHYFDGRLWIPALLGPLLLPALLLYAGAALAIAGLLRRWKREYFLIFTVLAFVEYYFFLPGPITVPRYQIPALPLLAILAAAAWCRLSARIRRRSGRSTPASPPPAAGL